MCLKQSGKASEELHLENGGGQGCQKDGDGMNISSISQQVQRLDAKEGVACPSSTQRGVLVSPSVTVAGRLRL